MLEWIMAYLIIGIFDTAVHWHPFMRSTKNMQSIRSGVELTAVRIFVAVIVVITWPMLHICDMYNYLSRK